jgi:hypothetical protein
MGTSVNKWPASPNPAEIGIREFTVNLTSGPKTLQLADAAGPALVAMIEWWDQNIEPVTQLGSYNYREIRGYEGTGKVSNHASGTAVDINWDKHPLGARGTIPAEKLDGLRARARELQLRWGGDYSGRADEHHIEVNVPPALFQLTALVPAQKGVVVIGAAFAGGAGLLTGALAHRRFDGDLRFTLGFALMGASVAGGLYALMRSA